MTNVDYAFGFELHAGPAEVIELEIDASNATTIGKGDPLTIEADGGNKRSVFTVPIYCFDGLGI